MKRVVCALIILVLLLSMLSFISCDITKTNKEHLLINACVRYSVAGFYKRDLKGNSPKIVEKDEYGRALMRYEAYNFVSDNERELVYVICQKCEDSAVYFYEDTNYLLNDKSKEGINRLKEQNDWGKKLDESKMSKRTVRITLDLFLTKDRIPDSKMWQSKWNKALTNYGYNPDDIISFEFCDWDCIDNELCFVRFYDGSEIFVIYNSENEFFIEKVNDNESYRETVIRLKEKSTWVKP